MAKWESRILGDVGLIERTLGTKAPRPAARRTLRKFGKSGKKTSKN
jgi:hypothetical protein